MLRLSKQILFALIFVIAAGCSGGGCSTGCSCAGVTPLATGFPVESRIENVGSLRLTDSGLTFLEQNLGALAGIALGGGDVLTFEIPTSSPNVNEQPTATTRRSRKTRRRRSRSRSPR